jgi:hypothetical protein
MTLHEYLLEQYPGQYEAVLRTLQRQVQEWKTAHGQPKEVVFEQEHPLVEWVYPILPT